MADVQWIKIKVGMFDGESFKKIKRAKIGGEKFRDKLTAVWFELMDFAGKCNHGGAFINSREIPFSNLEDIAIMIDRETEELELCMAFFINEGMVEIVDDVYMLTNWAQYQNEAGLEKLRAQKRERQARWRANKALKENVDDKTSTQASTVDATERLPSYSYSNSSSNKEIEIRGCGGKEKERKPQKHKHGEYQNVLLSDEELDKLKTEYSDWRDRIERLSSYVASTGKSYKSHYATIRNWAKRERDAVKKSSARQDYGDPEDFYK